MTASELISKLNEILQNRGDLDVRLGSQRNIIDDIKFCRDEEMISGDYIEIASTGPLRHD